MCQPPLILPGPQEPLTHIPQHHHLLQLHPVGSCNETSPIMIILRYKSEDEAVVGNGTSGDSDGMTEMRTERADQIWGG
eukprot:scaffold17477_cov41-Cyclotella_meneghiniana.AAC.9